MIPRYTRPEMAAIWAPETRYRIWFEIEAHAADALAELGAIPKAAAKAVWERGRPAIDDVDIARIDEIEREIHHDVIAIDATAGSGERLIVSDRDWMDYRTGQEFGPGQVSPRVSQLAGKIRGGVPSRIRKIDRDESGAEGKYESSGWRGARFHVL
jgi:hypothetical protein